VPFCFFFVFLFFFLLPPFFPGEAFSVKGMEGKFGIVTALWIDGKGRHWLEFCACTAPKIHKRLPYHGNSGLLLQADVIKNGLIEAMVGKKVTIESLEDFRVRETFEDTNFYICDVHMQRKLVPYTTARVKGTWEKRFQNYVANQATRSDLEALIRQDDPVSDELVVELQSTVAAPVRSYARARPENASRSVTVVSERSDGGILPASKVSEKPAQESEPVFVEDSEEERQRLLVQKGMLPEPGR
jgi:hypothetical protein